MGLFDKLKSAASSLTGGGATVTITPEPLVFGAPFSIVVSAVIGEKDLHARGVYLHVEGLEEVEIPNVRVAHGDSSRTETVRASHMTFRIEHPVADGQVFQAGRSYTWEVDVTIPDEAPRPFNGTLARHSIRAMAGIDAFGNDPDSGWKPLHD